MVGLQSRLVSFYACCIAGHLGTSPGYSLVLDPLLPESHAPLSPFSPSFLLQKYTFQLLPDKGFTEVCLCENIFIPSLHLNFSLCV